MNSKEFERMSEKSKQEYFRLWQEFMKLQRQLQVSKKGQAAPVQK